MIPMIWKKRMLPLAAAWALLSSLGSAQTAAPEDFRAIWLSTVSGLDFPGTVGTSNITNQRQKIISLLNACQAAGINAVIMQVRAECDAFYVSDIEPWSRWLTGTQGSAPSRLWDPLQFTIDECRRRGLEIHAWFNPYRAGVNRSASFAPGHPVNDYPQIVESYSSDGSNYYWLNPGHPDTVPYTMSVVMDVVKRYDIDGVHFDDYFYPYGITGGNPFPDSDEYNAYTAGGGSMSLADWRRNNVNSLVSQVRTAIAAVPGKEHVRFGISPFGIWRPGNPSGINGLDAYNSIFADSRKWLVEGWVDYMSPQLYWGMAEDGHSTGQDFDSLLNWWTAPAQNVLGRNIFPGLAAYRALDAGWDASHIVNQVLYTQNSSSAKGNIFFRTESLAMNGGAGIDNLSNLLKAGPYQAEGAPPAFPYMDAVAPGQPTLAWSGNSASGYTVYWTPQGAEYPQWYVVYWSNGVTWSHDVVPDWQRSLALPGSAVQVAVQALDRSGNRSPMTPVSLAGASPAIPAQPVSLNVYNHDTDSIDLFTGSGSNSGVVTQTDVSSTEEANNRIDPRAGTIGSSSRKVPFSWSGASGGFYRLSTFGTNPMIDLTKGVGVYIKLMSGELDLALGIRETGGSGPIGANGGTVGGIEATSRQRIKASPSWQYLHFDLPNESYTNFAGGNGALNGTWGVLEAFFIYQVSGTPSSYTIYIDEVHQGDPHTPLGEPIRPRRLQGNSAGSSNVTLTWNAVPALDLAGYRVYRSTSPNVTISEANRVAEVSVPTWVDTTAAPHTNYHYVVTAVDHFGYESPVSETFSIVAAPVTLSTFQME